MKPGDKHRVIAEVTRRVLDKHASSPQVLEQALFETLYLERQRLEKQRHTKRRRQERARYERIQSEALRAPAERQRELLGTVIRAFCEEVSGHFDPRVYKLATRVIPGALNLLLNALSPLRLLQELPGGMSRLDEQLVLEGECDALRKAASLGTTVLVPTHSSNLDSILVGFGLYRLGLPPYVYGAGLNLFSNKLIGFFMHNLGAYKVDRRKQASVYKDVLKTYAGHTMELGYHNLFFPGGTRSRSGSVEQKLKLGLLGQSLDAYIHNLRRKAEQPDIFVVPCTINYQLVLEAETLIDDHLKEVGKSRYIIEDDEFSKPKRILDFVQRIFSLDSRIHLVVSQPLDVFGNRVDEQGCSRDARGRPVDRTRYVQVDGEPAFDAQRDQEYTRELARSVAEAYLRDTVLSPIHLVAHTVFEWLRDRNPTLDLYRLLRTGGEFESMPLIEAYDRLERTLEALQRRAGRGELRLDERLKTRDSVAVMSHALQHLSSYHRRPALVRRGDRLLHIDRNLLLYYQARIGELSPRLGGAS
ncbi:MAG: 1-acyl-sn-glycerol-3-phosphate acyltransferase [Deltaproteobacteria bacterium]|nr:1-acyl-sn-glycerol-3-phosphate acyltransferase [Deltaproteobacteria bacterium]